MDIVDLAHRAFLMFKYFYFAIIMIHNKLTIGHHQYYNDEY